MEVQEDPIPLLTTNNMKMEDSVMCQQLSNNNASHSSDSDSQSGNNNNNDHNNRFNNYLNRGSELWTHWTWLGGQGKMSLMKCNYCQVNKQLKNAPKCRRHLIKCEKTPSKVREYFKRREYEASKASAFMREIRSKEMKFAKNSNSNNNTNNDASNINSQPTAKLRQHLQQPVMTNGSTKSFNGNSINSGITNGHHQPKIHLNRHSLADQIVPRPSVLKNYSPMINRNSSKNVPQDYSSSSIIISNSNSKNKHSIIKQESNGDDSMVNGIDYNLLCQLQLMSQNSSMLVPETSIIDTSNSILSQKSKRKPIESHQSMNGGKENSINHETPNKRGNNIANNNTVVINLDEIGSMDDSLYFNSMFDTSPNNGHYHHQNGESLICRKKKRNDSPNINGGNGILRMNGGNFNNNNYEQELGILNPIDVDIIHDDLNDLLISALISQGIELEFVKNSYFQKFINQLVKFSTSIKNYRLPSVDKLCSNNIQNLIRKFDYETSKLFSECDSIVVSFENNAKTTDSSNIETKRIDVNLLISSSNNCLKLFYKTIPFSSMNDNEDINLKMLNNQMDSLFNKIDPAQINAVILPYKDDKSSEQINSYLSSCHSHIVPLNNSYKLFHNLLCSICRIPSIHKLITQCTTLFKDLETNLLFMDFSEANHNHWKQVFESDNLKILRFFLDPENNNKIGGGSLSIQKNTYWISLNLMLCWFLVARSSIIELFENKDKQENGMNAVMKKSQLESMLLDSFFDEISILFNFLTPFINAMHMIENESTVISDIIKIYYDVKFTINDNNFFNGINKLCNKTERQALDSILNDYLQEQNFSRYFFLAYYLDPRFRDDRRIEENEELTAQVYDALFNYANALGCVTNAEEDRENLVDSLEEFRNGDKLYGTQLLKCPKSPSKFWKHLRRFPNSSKLAYCASRLLSISTWSMLIQSPEDNSVNSLYETILKHNQRNNSNNTDTEQIDLSQMIEKILPIKSYLVFSGQKMQMKDEENDFTKQNTDMIPIPNNKNGADPESYTNGSTNDSRDNNINVSTLISNVISSLNQYTLFIAQPFSESDLSIFIQPSTN